MKLLRSGKLNLHSARIGAAIRIRIRIRIRMRVRMRVRIRIRIRIRISISIWRVDVGLSRERIKTGGGRRSNTVDD